MILRIFAYMSEYTTDLIGKIIIDKNYVYIFFQNADQCVVFLSESDK